MINAVKYNLVTKWLIELSQRLNIDIETELEKFLAKREQQLSIDLEKIMIRSDLLAVQILV